MGNFIAADTVDGNGKVHKSVGENIREGSNTSIIAMCGAIKTNTDRAKMCDKLNITAQELKTALFMLLTGKTAHFGGLDVDAFSATEIADIKAYLGIV